MFEVGAWSADAFENDLDAQLNAFLKQSEELAEKQRKEEGERTGDATTLSGLWSWDDMVTA